MKAILGHIFTCDGAAWSTDTPVSMDVHPVGIGFCGTPLLTSIPSAAMVDLSIEVEGKDTRFVH